MSIIHKVARIISKHAPTLLTIAGTAGVIGTAVVSSKATLTYKDQIQEELDVIEHGPYLTSAVPEEYSEEDFRKDRIKCYAIIAGKTAKHYAPAVAIGAASIACFWWSHNIQSRRIAGLAAAYAAVNESYKKYKKAIRDHIGEDIVDKAEKVMFENATSSDDWVDISDSGEFSESVIPDYSPYSRFIDENSSIWDSSSDITELNIRSQLNYMNDILRTRGYVFLSDVYDALGIPRTPASQVVGWLWNKGDGDHYISFGNIEEHRIQFYDESRRKTIAVYLLDFNVDGEIVNDI